MNKFLTILISLLLLASCQDTVDKLKRVGRAPDFENIELPTIEEDEEEIERREERLRSQHAHMRKTNSLWQPGSTKFFRDSRAWKVGDIIRVVVEIKDNASLNNSTQQNRSGKDNLGLSNLFGKEKAIQANLPTTANLGSLVSTNSSRNHTGSGNISRKEDVKTEIAATVTKVLPSGNLVVQGHQEVRVNYELREIKVAGIIRPKDITSDNSIKTNQMAEARISYGGRGVVSDMQQPRAGSQVIDIISPF
ncbi:MAG: flagellar basal body L-ring protein FlgH [Rickettsiaceae bacterium]|nr:flagellar basal body L-ring protein FlgH [Rickettsiaceae bacterium]